MKKDARERFTLRLPTTLFSKLQVNGEELGVSTNALILQILWDWMEHKENEDLKIERQQRNRREEHKKEQENVTKVVIR